jgi:hypothetical protein
LPSLFFSYSHKDEGLRDQLETQLAMLKRQGVIDAWHDRRIPAGGELDREIDQHINTDDIILLLVSPDFIASDYCYEVEMKRAMERHDAGEAIVIPVILRACDWHPAPFGRLRAVPRDGKPVKQWTDLDEAFLDVAKEIRAVAERFSDAEHATPAATAPAATAPVAPATAIPAIPTPPRSSNLRVAKTFSQRDKDAFKHETFAFMARFFENSLDELAARNPELEGVFRHIDANRFTAVVYRAGAAVCSCTIFMGGGFGNGINFVHGETSEINSINESLRVEADDQTLYFSSMGMAMFNASRGRDMKLSQEGAAELYWGLLIAPLQ